MRSEDNNIGWEVAMSVANSLTNMRELFFANNRRVMLGASAFGRLQNLNCLNPSNYRVNIVNTGLHEWGYQLVMHLLGQFKM